MSGTPVPNGRRNRSAFSPDSGRNFIQCGISRRGGPPADLPIGRRLQGTHTTHSQLDARYDKLHTLTETQEQRIDVLAKMNSPDKLEFRNREISKLLTDTANALDRVKHLEVMHNTKHPPVSNERRAE